MTRVFYSADNSVYDWVRLSGSDLPSLSTIPGLLDIHQISPDGVTGQSILDIGNNTLGWRYPAHIAGTGGYYILPYPISAPTTDVISGVANQIDLMRIYIDNTVSVDSITFAVSVQDAGNFASVGLYDILGNLVFTTGAQSTTTRGAKTTTLSGIGTILRGVYYWAWTCDSTTMGFAGFDPTGSDFHEILNAGVAHRLTASETSTAGVLPDTIDISSLSTSTDAIAVGKLQGG